MNKRPIGTSGLEACPVALGTWAIGGGQWWGETEDAESVRAIQASLDAGINLIDTAPIYGFGRSEEVVGKALEGRRDKAIIATKAGLWWHDDRGGKFFDMGDKTVRRSLRPETIREELEMSLRRLKTDVIDLYQTHWQVLPEDPTPIAETMACLVKMKEEGKIRAIGVSNCTPAQMDEYRAVGTIDANQPRYSMLDRAIEDDLLPYCRENHIAILAYSPLEQGLLAGKIDMAYELDKNEYRNNLPWIANLENRRRVLDMLEKWEDLEEKYKCTLAQLVIAWTLAQPGITFALCGARKQKHVLENADAATIELEADDIARIRRDVEALGQPA